MAKKTLVGGIATRTNSGTTFVDMAAVKTEMPGEFQQTIPSNLLQTWSWSPWGANNLFPQELTREIESCGILNSIIDGRARFALCEGMTPAIVKRDKDGKRTIDSYVEDPEILDFLEMNNAFHQTFGWMRDQCGIGNGVARYLLDKGRKKIARFMRHDVTEMRYQKKNENGRIDNVFFSANWSFNGATNSIAQDPFKIPLLDPNNPVVDLQNRTNQSREFALTFQNPGWGKHYYSTPLWYAAIKWVKIAQGVPEMKSAMFENTMVLKYMVIIHETFWSKRFGDEWENMTDEQREQKRNEFYDEVDEFLVGAENAHKSIFVNGYMDPVTKATWQDIEIKRIDGQGPQGEYLPDAASANAEIAFANLFNPAILGASMPSGPYTNSQGGSNVRESVLLQVVLHEFERRNIQRVMNVIKYVNGWHKKHPGLEFIIPATVLTTLDTGGATKPVTLGANTQPQQKNPSNNGTDKNN